MSSRTSRRALALIAFPAILVTLLTIILLVARWIFPGTAIDRRLPAALPVFPAPRLQADPQSDMAAIPENRTGKVEQRRLGRSRQGSSATFRSMTPCSASPAIGHSGLAEMIAAIAADRCCCCAPRAWAAPDLAGIRLRPAPGQPASADRNLHGRAGQGGHPAASPGQPPHDPRPGLLSLPQPLRPGAGRPDECLVAHRQAG